MKKLPLLLILIAISLVSFRPVVPASSWSLDAAHSQLGFSLSLLGLSDISGSFKIKEGTLTAPKDDFSDASVTIVADVNSVDTDNDDRDKHLKTADFFDGAKYPDLTFRSSSFKKINDSVYSVNGDLTLHGVTKSVILSAIGKTGTHPVTSQTVSGFKVAGVIRRSDFGISAATPSSMLSDEVIIRANVQFIKK